MDPTQLQVLEFREKFNLPVGEKPTLIPPKNVRLHVRLIAEELEEYARAAGLDLRIRIEETRTSPVGGPYLKPNLVEVADGLADLDYAVKGAASEHGIDLAPCVREVHRSNMTKDGSPDAGGKITKGPGFRPPNIAPLLERMAHEPVLAPTPEETLRHHAAELGDALRLRTPPGVGFGFFLFDFGVKGNMAWISNADRETMIPALQEWIGKAQPAAAGTEG